MKNYIVIMIAVSFVSLACEKEIELKESDIKTRIVLNGLFEANDTMRISLSESRDILYNNGGLLPNILTAKAELFGDDNTSLGQFVHEGEGRYYLPNYMPVAEKNYTLKVENDGFDAIDSKTNVPKAVTISNIDTTRKGEFMDVEVTFQDNNEVDNYYSINVVTIEQFVFEVAPGEFDTSYYFDNSYSCSKDINTYGVAGPEGDICADGGLLFTDGSFNGAVYSYKVEKYVGSNTIVGENQEGKVVGLVIILKSMSPDLYKYKTTLQKYNEGQGNPFGEPVQVFSNVNDGFGIFAGQSVYSTTVFF